jgi:hypothetical protein
MRKKNKEKLQNIKLPKKTAVPGLKLFNTPGFFSLESGALYWISGVKDRNTYFLLNRKFGESTDCWVKRAGKYTGKTSKYRKKLVLGLPALFSIIITFAMSCLLFVICLNPAGSGLFRQDCCSITGSMINVPEHMNKKLYVVVHYKKVNDGIWESEKKAVDNSMISHKYITFGLCGEGMKKIQEYYLDWHAEN